MGIVVSGGALQLMVRVECSVSGIGADLGPEHGEMGGSAFSNGCWPTPALLVVLVLAVPIDSFEVVD